MLDVARCLPVRCPRGSDEGSAPGRDVRFTPWGACEPAAGAARETRQSMNRMLPLLVVVVCLVPGAGCEGLGLYRAAGHIPGTAPTDYAFYNFFGTSSQLYQFSAQQVESSAVEALGDLGFRPVEPPSHLPEGVTILRARTPDGRPAKIKISPQNSLTNVRVEIGPVHIGDEELSRDLFRRIAANFGTAVRVYTPIDPTLPKRLNVSSGFVPRAEPTPPLELKGDGLRPNENRDKAAGGEAGIPADDSSTASGGAAALQALMQRGGLRPNPNVPYGTFPMPPNPYLPFPMPTNDQDAP
jgi:hypothetical protein